MASIPNPNKQPKIDHDRDPNYSVDEMMANLKRRDQRKKKQPNSSKGELITREDGSQAIKVRRKKRRSKQTNKKETPRTNSKIKWAVFLLAGISFIFFIAFSVFIIAKYNGRNFKAQTESNISNLTGANKTKITQIRVTPISAKAQKADLTWNTDSFLKNANFVNIRANIKPTSFLRNDWVGEEIVSSAGKIHLQAPQPKTEKLNTNNLISPYQFRSYRCDQLSLYFGNDEKKSPAISNALVSLRKLANGQNQIVFRHGKIRIENDSVMDLPSAILTLNENNARLEALINAQKNHDGEIRLEGEIPKLTQKPVNLNLTAKNFPIQKLLKKDLGQMIQGEIQSDLGTFYYNCKKPSAEALNITIPFKSSKISIKGFSFLKALNKLTGNAIYTHPVFLRCNGTIIKTFEKIIIKDLELINNNLLSIQGNLSVNTNGRLEGELTIGVPQSTFKKEIPYPFSGPTSGFCHAKIQLDGNIKTPNDNLLELLKKNPKPTKSSSKENLLKPIIPKQTQPIPNESDYQELTR